MSDAPRMNDAPILDQIDGQYMKFLMMVLIKYLPGAAATITAKDIAKIAENNLEPDPMVLFVHGHKDSVEFKAIRRSEATVIAQHNKATHEGHA